MNSNNKKRLLTLIEILKKNTDSNHTLSLQEISRLLQEKGIEINNRKTLYDDFKILNESGYVVDYTNGYYLNEAPFTVSEIKIIIDSLNSLKNLDDSFLNNLTDKLYSFISTYETELLKKLEFHIKHKDKKFINRLEDTLQAINTSVLIQIKRNNKDPEIIAPLFLYRTNDYYYLYYHYENSDKIYHTRFDNIVSIKLTDKINEISIPRNVITGVINDSTNSFYTDKSQYVEFKILKDSDYLRNRLADDFSNIVFSKDGFSIKASVNEAFFSKITSYGSQIKFADKNIGKSYTDYLKSIINIHTKQ